MDFSQHTRSGNDFVIGRVADDDPAYEKGEQLILKLLCGISERTKPFCTHRFIDLPYTYSERQLDSVILPTLSQLCGGLVLAELPVDRVVKSEDGSSFSSGRVDYWCIYRGYTFVIEVKHSYDGIKNNITRQDTLQCWETMVGSQLKSIRKTIRQCCEEKTRGVIRLGLHFITSYSISRPSHELIRNYRLDLPEILRRLTRDMGKVATAPNFACAWEIPWEYVRVNTTETYCGLIVIAKIHHLLQF